MEGAFLSRAFLGFRTCSTYEWNSLALDDRCLQDSHPQARADIKTTRADPREKDQQGTAAATARVRRAQIPATNSRSVRELERVPPLDLATPQPEVASAAAVLEELSILRPPIGQHPGA